MPGNQKALFDAMLMLTRNPELRKNSATPVESAQIITFLTKLWQGSFMNYLINRDKA